MKTAWKESFKKTKNLESKVKAHEAYASEIIKERYRYIQRYKA